jgi:competence protein ComEC
MKNTTFIGLIIIFLLDLIAFSFFIEMQPQNLEVSFFDVGQGDCIFIETPDKQQILIDAGPNNSLALEKVYANMPWWDKTIDLVVLTHPESDHARGMFNIFDNYQIDNIAWTGVNNNKEIRDDWVKTIYNEESKRYILNKGDKIIALNVIFEVINPEKELKDVEMKEVNDTSLVLKMNYGNSSFLFPGDISSKIEKTLDNIDVDVLKISHHGSKYSTSQSLIDKTSPLMAIIQVGKNSYGHPSEEVLTRLDNFGINIFKLRQAQKYKRFRIF